MPKRRTPAPAKVLTQLSSLSVAAPQVIAHRVARMATAGPLPSHADRKEFVGMVVEKPMAFAASLQNMWLAAAWANWNLMASLSRSLLQPKAYTPAASAKLARRIGRTGLSVVSKGLAPIERKASANARRLSRTRR